jgi:hypothetical protein
MTAAGRASENRNDVESLFLSLLEDGKGSDLKEIRLFSKITRRL